MKKPSFWLTGCLAGVWVLALATAVLADDHQTLEAELFTESAGTTTTAAGSSNLPVLIPTPEAKTIGFSGQITSAGVNQISNTQAANALYTYTVSDVFLDARLPQDAKVFADLEAVYLSQNQITQVALQELFFDFNFSRAIYFRTGKQVLQWGRCYLWNPTDLINIEKPHFIPKIGTREGAYGLKMHVPFGTTVNLYSFIDTGNVMDTEHTAAAVKAEFLLGNFEIAFSGWGKKGYHPVWGTDFSTRLLGLDTLGEVAVSQSEIQPRAQVEGGRLVLRTSDQSWVPKVSLNFSRSFTPGNFKDQLTVMVEGYYDRAGYAGDVLADATDYPFAQPVAGQAGVTTHGTFQDFITLNHLYQPNYFSRAYVALFITYTQFLLTDMVLNANYIRNMVDGSGQASLGVTYTQLNSFTTGALAVFNLGGPDREYTFSDERGMLQLTLGISF